MTTETLNKALVLRNRIDFLRNHLEEVERGDVIAFHAERRPGLCSLTLLTEHFPITSALEIYVSNVKKEIIKLEHEFEHL
jgi:hypothetical protein